MAGDFFYEWAMIGRRRQAFVVDAPEAVVFGEVGRRIEDTVEFDRVEVRLGDVEDCGA